MSRRVRVTGLHLIVSLSVAVVAAAMIFLVWFPSPLATVAGGLRLFGLLSAIDVVLGPLLTCFVASANKPKRELRRDIGFIAAVQLIAFVYGVYSIALARPVLLVLEVDRLQIVSAADISPGSLERALPEFRELSWTGPRLVAVRRSKNVADTLRSMDQAAEGLSLPQQPERWIDYVSQKELVLREARLASALLTSNPDIAPRLARLADESGLPTSQLRYLPLLGRGGSAVALIAPPDARIVGYLPIPAP